MCRSNRSSGRYAAGRSRGGGVCSGAKETTGATDGGVVVLDDLHERIAAELMADPAMEALLTEALGLVGDDPDAAATLVRLRLRREHPADHGARTTLGRAVALAV